MNAQRKAKIEAAVVDVLTYFDFFSYAPSKEELHTFLPTMVHINELDYLDNTKLHAGGGMFALRNIGHSIERRMFSEEKIKSARLFISIMKHFPWVYLIGLSGSCAMMNARESDDIDFFIMSAPGGLWLTRLTAIMVAKLLGRHRSRSQLRVKDTFCLNLYFDIHDCSVPQEKRNLYTAHEVVQMRPIYMREGVYETFMSANSWVREYFPNIKQIHEKAYAPPSRILSMFLKCIEPIAKSIQMHVMSPVGGKERISDTQLWFFPDDFQQKVQKKMSI